MNTSAALPARVDVLVIGGGFAGASTARALVEAGVRDVVVLEREAACGYHASGRNAALCRQITEHEAFTELTVRGAAFLAEPPPEFSEAPLLQRTGSILLTDDQASASVLLARAAAWDVPARSMARAEVIARWPRLEAAPFGGAIAFPTDGVIDVHALLQGFLAGARAGGARVIVRCEVQGFRGGSAEVGVEVDTSLGPVRARCVVMAAGAWVSSLGARAAGRDVAYAPIQRHLFVTQAAAELDAEAPFVWHLGAREFYARPEGAGYLVSGCDETRVEPCDAVVLPGAVEQLAERLGDAAPALAELGVARSWSCVRTFAPDRCPVVDWDRDQPWLFWVAGLGGHGATASPAIGETAAARIMTRIGARV
ncbi:MAG TPA: FAD-dependent oxidoreductase [Kofleriaceae bacterium]|nr:FAD-dependent oxidoreductase [Kofleriaceae bacterium]